MSQRVFLGPQGEPIFIRDDSQPRPTLRGPQGEIIIQPGAKPAPDVDQSRPLRNKD